MEAKSSPSVHRTVDSRRRLSSLHSERAGGLLYVLNSFPRLTETFILRELLALEDAGERILIESLRPPDLGPRHPELSELRAEVRYLARGIHLLGPRTLWSHLTLALLAPRRWAQLAWRSARSGRGAWGRFFKAGLVAVRARKCRIRHIHAHFVDETAEVARDAGFLAELPVTVTAHAYDVFKRENASQVASRLAGVAGVFTVSQYNLSHLRSLVPELPVHYVPSCIPLSSRAGDIPRGPVLCIARLVRKKGIDVLIDAVALLANSLPELRAEIIGAGPLADELCSLADGRGVSDRVRFLGAKSSQEVDLALRGASMFVLASRIATDGDREGMPTVLLEALARGLPVISTNTSGISEVIQNGRTGLLVPPDDPSALALAIAQLWNDRSLAGRLGDAGRSVIAERFSPSRNAKLLQALFEHTDRSVSH
jgi:glycosyltransferase involved in cell wall biosynthesis